MHQLPGTFPLDSASLFTFTESYGNEREKPPPALFSADLDSSRARFDWGSTPTLGTYEVEMNDLLQLWSIVFYR